MDHLGTIIPSRGHAIYDLEANGRVANVEATTSVPGWFLEAYEALGRASDPVYTAVQQYGTPIDSGRLLRWRLWRHEAVYEILNRVEFQRSLQAPVVVKGGGSQAVTLLLSPTALSSHRPAER